MTSNPALSPSRPVIMPTAEKEHEGNAAFLSAVITHEIIPIIDKTKLVNDPEPLLPSLCNASKKEGGLLDSGQIAYGYYQLADGREVLYLVPSARTQVNVPYCLQLVSEQRQEEDGWNTHTDLFAINYTNGKWQRHKVSELTKSDIIHDLKRMIPQEDHNLTAFVGRFKERPLAAVRRRIRGVNTLVLN